MKKYILSVFSLLFLTFFSFHFLVAQQVQYKEKQLEITKHNTDRMDEATLRADMKSDGLSDPMIDKLIAQRKLWEQQGRNVSWTSARNAQPPVVNAPCNGLGVEGGWGAWLWQEGTNSGGNPPTWVGSPAANPASAPVLGSMTGPGFAITSGTGIDPNTPGPNPGDPKLPFVCPGFGNNSIQLGDVCGAGLFGGSPVNSNVQQLTYPLTVTAQDTNFIYSYAIVIEDPNGGHTAAQSPYVEFGIYDASGTAIPCSFQHYIGGPTIPGFYYVNGNSCGAANVDQYKPWTLVGINLSAYVGQTLNVVITNADCTLGGHFAYSYWDFLCGTAALSAGCTGKQSTICGPSDPQIAYTYQWYHNGSAMAAPQGTQECITVISQPNDTFSVAVHQPSGCNFHMGYTPASIQPGFLSTGSCGIYTYTDTTRTSPANVSLTSWNWSFPGGTPATATTQSATVTYTTPGTYSTTLVVTCSAGCSDTVRKTITVNALPVAAFTSNPACLGNPITLINGSIYPAGDPITQWDWSIPGGTPATATGTVVTTTFSPPAGPHTVTLTVTTQAGCKASVPQQILVYAPPVAAFSGGGAGCSPLCVTNFADLSTSANGNITNWAWSFPGGSPSSFAGQTPPQICYSAPGAYGASLIVTSTFGCKDSVNITPLVNVYSWPHADFCLSPNTAPGTDPVFTFCPLWSPNPGVSSWAWNFGDGIIDSVNTNPVHSYSATATGNDFYNYTICLNVKNQYGCWDSVCKPVEILPEFEFYIPNSFSPNGDNINDLFFGKCRGVKDYNIWVFDRWGNNVWDCHFSGKNTDFDKPGSDGMSANCKWDGVVVRGGMDLSGGSGNAVLEDVYVWKVKLTDVFDKPHSYVGSVTVVK